MRSLRGLLFLVLYLAGMAATVVAAPIGPLESPKAATLCDIEQMKEERAVLLAPALSLAHGAATRAVRAGHDHGAVRTIHDYAATYWWALHALHRSPEWKDWQERWQPCVDREGWAWSP